MNFNLLSHPDYWWVTFVASFLIWIMFGTLLILWLFKKGVRTQNLLVAILTSIVAWLMTEALKNIFSTTRPFVQENIMPLTITIPKDNAFPSTHSSTSFALAVSVARNNPRLGLYYFLSAFIVALGRIWANVHYFRDVFMGAIIGIYAYILVEKINPSVTTK